MAVVVAAVPPILVGRAVNVAFQLGLAFGAAVEAVAVRPAVLSCTLFTSSSTSASTSAAVSSSSIVVSTCLVVVVVAVALLLLLLFTWV